MNNQPPKDPGVDLDARVQAVKEELSGRGKPAVTPARPAVGKLEIPETAKPAQPAAAQQPPKTQPPKQQPPKKQDPPIEETGEAEPERKSPKEDLRDLVRMFDSGGMQTLRQNLLANSARKRLIEDRCRKQADEARRHSNITTLLSNNWIIERVPVIPGKLEPEFRTLTQMENVEIHKLLSEQEGSQAHLEQMYYLFRLACSLVSINGEPLPQHLFRDQGAKKFTFNAQRFNEKMDYLMNRPMMLVAELLIQLEWFEDRVKKLFLEDDLKNG